MLKGTFLATKKNGEHYYRSSITYQNKHISLGSFQSEEEAHQVYLEACRIVFQNELHLYDYHEAAFKLPFSKWVTLHNFRDNGMYFKTPIYLYPKYFIYFLDVNTELKFDVDDLFYYSTHQIMRRQGYMFVSDYGMQVNILSRYGIKNFAVEGRDYQFVNGDTLDYRYGNIEIINRYYGVTCENNNGRKIYTAKIHIHGDYMVGRYSSEIDAAIAYNKAAEMLTQNGLQKEFTTNYILHMNSKEYLERYHTVRISNRIQQLRFN